MSRALETARRGLRLWSQGDLDGSLSLMRPNVEWHLAFELPDLPRGKTVYRGRSEVRQVWDAFRSAWEEITIELDEPLVDEKDDRLLARARFRGRGSASGIEIDRTVFYLFDLDEQGLLARIWPFDTEEEARRVFESNEG